MNLDLMIFDLGGTTIRDRGEVPASFSKALQTHGIPFREEELQAWRGASKREVLRQLIARSSVAAGTNAEALTQSAYASFHDELKDRLAAAHPIAIDGAGETFQELHKHGIRVGINTGFDREITNQVLRAAGWDSNLIDAVVCSDEVEHGRPAPDMIFRSMELVGVREPSRVGIAGDTLLDLQAGANAGVSVRVGVLTGAYRREQLEKGPFTHILTSVADIPHQLF